MTQGWKGEALLVVGYGSLICNPEFPVTDRQVARAEGWHRSFRKRSIHHRNSVESPGLVLALGRQPDRHCDGIAFAVAAGAEATTVQGAARTGVDLISL